MDANLLDELERQHRMVDELLEQLADTEEPEAQQALLGELRAALEEHIEIEEQRVYPELAKLDGEMAEEATSEHQLAREGLAKAEAMVGQPGFGAAVEMLQAGIEHHVNEEETEAFPRLRAVVGGGNGRRPASPSAAEASRDELYEKAKKLDIAGRSSMSKEELAEAIAAAEE